VNLSIKDRQRYKDIEWLMPSVDVVDVLERLNAESIAVRGHEVDAMCPDHHMFVDRDPSHPRWSCNRDTGETYCFTEPRGSNLFWTVARLLDAKNPNEVVRFMTGKDAGNIQSSLILGKINKLRRGKRVDKKDPVKLYDIREDLVNRYISDACYDFFVNPPSKKPTNITRATVDRYQIFERRWGYYSNRAVIPFFMHGELVGFCAIDLLGQRQWLLEHPLNDENDYKKTLYPPNFRSKLCLFGYDDVEVGCDQLLITEGAREVMKITQEGFSGVACGKADLSDEQIELLSRKAPKEVILFFDGDESGWSATDKNAKKLERVFRVRKCYLPVGQDPKNFCAEDIKNIIKRSKLA
jgi:5S rRNA maturation endonuclease (ribonuclease M5)